MGAIAAPEPSVPAEGPVGEAWGASVGGSGRPGGAAGAETGSGGGRTGVRASQGTWQASSRGGMVATVQRCGIAPPPLVCIAEDLGTTRVVALKQGVPDVFFKKTRHFVRNEKLHFSHCSAVEGICGEKGNVAPNSPSQVFLQFTGLSRNTCRKTSENEWFVGR